VIQVLNVISFVTYLVEMREVQ